MKNQILLLFTGLFFTAIVFAQIPVTNISLSKNEATLGTNSIEELSQAIISQNETWVSRDNSVATGNNIGIASGDALISVISENIPVTDIYSDKDSLKLEVGGIEKLSPIIIPQNATNKNVTWASRDNSVATVDSNGYVTGITPGYTLISVTSEDGGKTGYCSVSVKEKASGNIPVTDIYSDKDSLKLEVGGIEKLSPIIIPQNATNKNVTWASRDNSVATVDSNGYVTGIAPGYTLISVTSEDGGKTGYCSVSVKEKATEQGIITLISAPGTDAQTVNIGSEITPIIYTWKNSPKEPQISWGQSNTAPNDIQTTIDSNKKDITISGILTKSGTYSYTISLDSIIQVTGKISSKSLSKITPILQNINATPLEEGQLLSESTIFGKAVNGNVSVPGKFSWENPNITVKAGEQTYKAIFIPTDSKTYNSIETEVPVSVIKYYTITPGVCTNGNISILNRNSNDKYAEGDSLYLQANPVQGYKFVSWAGDFKGTSNPTSLTVQSGMNANSTINAIFEKTTHLVSVNRPLNGTLLIKNGSETVTDGDMIPYGTTLSVTAVPDNNFTLDSLKANGYNINKGSLFVDKDVVITASFKALPPAQKRVSVIAENGTVIIRNASTGALINSGSSIDVGTTILISTEANNGYNLGNPGLSVNGATLNGDNSYTVNDALTITANFVKNNYSISVTASDIIFNPSIPASADYGTAIQINAISGNPDYRIISLTVNGKDIPNNSEIKISDRTFIAATTAPKDEILIDTSTQTYVYDGKMKTFAIRTVPSKISGFDISYSEIPVYAGTYSSKEYLVTISRPADSQYKAVNTTAKLIIDAAEPEDIEIPTATNGILTSQTEAGIYTWIGGTATASDIATENIQDVEFTPANTNYKKVKFSIWNGFAPEPGKVNLVIKNSKTKKIAETSASSIQINCTNGNVTAWNGTQRLTEGQTIYIGQHLSFNAIPDDGFAANKGTVWKLNGQSVAENTNTYSFDIRTGENNVEVIFSPKNNPAISITGAEDRVFNGSLFGDGNTPSAEGWTLKYKQNGIAIDNPVNAGEYEIFGNREEDEDHIAVNDFSTGRMLKITQAVPEVEHVEASPVMNNQPLFQSVITGSSSTDGIFSWSDGSLIVNNSGTYYATFTPSSSNYVAVDRIPVTVDLEQTGTQDRFNRFVYFEPLKNGTITVLLNGKAITPGTIVYNGDILNITAILNEGYSITSATIDNIQYTIGEDYKIPDSGDNITIVIEEKLTGIENETIENQIICTKYYTLGGIYLGTDIRQQNGEIYIRKTIYKNGKVKTDKIMTGNRTSSF